MSFLNEEIKKLKGLLKTAFDDPEQKKEGGLFDAKFDTLPDGSTGTTNIDVFEVGAKVELVNADGTLSPAPDGDYVSDATSQPYTVKGGFIVSIGEVPVAAAAPAAAPAKPIVAPAVKPAAAETPVQVATEAAQVATLIKQVTAMQTAIDALKALVATMQVKMSEQFGEDEKKSAQFAIQFSELNTVLNTIAKIPVEDSKITTKNAVKDDKELKLKELALLLGKK